jgi:hypothetical protein
MKRNAQLLPTDASLSPSDPNSTTANTAPFTLSTMAKRKARKPTAAASDEHQSDIEDYDKVTDVNIPLVKIMDEDLRRWKKPRKNKRAFAGLAPIWLRAARDFIVKGQDTYV